MLLVIRDWIIEVTEQLLSGILVCLEGIRYG